MIFDIKKDNTQVHRVHGNCWLQPVHWQRTKRHRTTNIHNTI